MFILKALGNISVDTSSVRHTWTICNWSINFSIISLDKEPWEIGSGSDSKQELPQSPSWGIMRPPRMASHKIVLPFSRANKSVLLSKGFFFPHGAQHLPWKSPVMPGR